MNHRVQRVTGRYCDFLYLAYT